MLNPVDVVNGGKPKFGTTHELILVGMGIRGFEQVDGTFFLATEPPGGKGRPHLFSWDGKSNRPRRVFVTLPKNANPESVLIFPDTGLNEIHILSDDGSQEIGGDPCNELDNADQRRFRRLILSR